MRYQYFADPRPCLHVGFLPSVNSRSGKVAWWKSGMVEECGPSGFCLWFFDGGVVFKLCRELCRELCRFKILVVIAILILIVIVIVIEHVCESVQPSRCGSQFSREMPKPCGEKGSTKPFDSPRAGHEGCHAGGRNCRQRATRRSRVGPLPQTDPVEGPHSKSAISVSGQVRKSEIGGEWWEAGRREGVLILLDLWGSRFRAPPFQHSIVPLLQHSIHPLIEFACGCAGLPPRCAGGFRGRSTRRGWPRRSR